VATAANEGPGTGTRGGGAKGRKQDGPVVVDAKIGTVPDTKIGTVSLPGCVVQRVLGVLSAPATAVAGRFRAAIIYWNTH
jgi:hypothetical protein